MGQIIQDQVLAGADIYFFSEMHILALGPVLVQWVPEVHPQVYSGQDMKLTSRHI